jgi:hypothetical protein
MGLYTGPVLRAIPAPLLIDLSLQFDRGRPTRVSPRQNFLRGRVLFVKA